MNERAASLRDARHGLIQDRSLQGGAFGAALASLLDTTLADLVAEHATKAKVALVALGSYGRREMCPGSDVDVLLLWAGKGKAAKEVQDLAEHLWYPLWDAGFVTGHAARTVKDTLVLADDDFDALTSIVEVRHVAGDASLTEELAAKGRQLVQRRSDRVLKQLTDAAELRRHRPGQIAEMLEPDLKDGSGGLRDIQSLGWAGWALGAPGDMETLLARNFLTADDAARIETAREHLLRLRVALHRVTGSHSDRLALQDQDAVAALLDVDDADTLVRKLAASAREVAWIARDVWARAADAMAGPSGRVAARDRVLAEGVVLRDGRVTVLEDAPITAQRVLDAAACAAEEDAPFDRASLRRLATMPDPEWDVWERAAFIRLLRAGANAVPVFEALDHQGALVRILPEWEHVRSLPQRNAYHRFTVDRHLLEAVAECARLLDSGDAKPQAGPRGADFDAIVARACRRPELLLLGALLHDIGKGLPEDHSVAGARISAELATRIGLDTEGREILVWLVTDHLLMADTSTRRDLADASVVESVAATCAGDAERLRLLYLLTIGDSRATGPAAWGPSKASLMRDLFVKAAAAIERGEVAALARDRRDALAARIGADAARAHFDRFPESYALAFDDALMAGHVELLRELPAIDCRIDDRPITVTVAAPDQPGLLATLAGALTVAGLDVLEAHLFSTDNGIALDVFRAADPFGRVDDDGAKLRAVLQQALRGEIDVAARVEARGRNYQVTGADRGLVQVAIVVDESASDTVIEVHADDEVGLLFRIASAFAAMKLDVRLAKVATLGQRVVDSFYVRDASGEKIADPDAAEALRAELIDRVTTS